MMDWCSYSGFIHTARQLLVVVGVLLSASCGGSKGPNGPTDVPPPVQSISLTCPSDITQTDLMVTTQTITYNAPTVTGGARPVTVTCTPASGSAFPLGTTTVTCEAS